MAWSESVQQYTEVTRKGEREKERPCNGDSHLNINQVKLTQFHWETFKLYILSKEFLIALKLYQLFTKAINLHITDTATSSTSYLPQHPINSKSYIIWI